MSRSLQSVIVGEAKRTAPVTSCEQVMRLTFRSNANTSQVRDLARETTTQRIQISGDHATIVSAQRDKTLTSAATREGGVWKLSEAPR
jgi:hypothetical protein